MTTEKSNRTIKTKEGLHTIPLQSFLLLFRPKYQELLTSSNPAVIAAMLTLDDQNILEMKGQRARVKFAALANYIATSPYIDDIPLSNPQAGEQRCAKYGISPRIYNRLSTIYNENHLEKNLWYHHVSEHLPQAIKNIRERGFIPALPSRRS